MAVMVGSARSDERGKAKGGKAGDQTGKEVSTQAWYLHSKGWRVFRCKDPHKAGMITEDMAWACANKRIGYDQSQRNTLYNLAKKVGFNCAKITTNCETDCSALVRVCCAYAGIMLSDFNTGTEPSVLLKSGYFEELTGTKYTKSSDYLRAGDILVTKTKGHTVIILTNGKKAYGDVETKHPTLSRGNTGDVVREMQTLLLKWKSNSLPEHGADGDFGTETENAVKKFQTAHGLKPDGVCGPLTWAELEKVSNPSPAPAPAPEPVKYKIDALDLSQHNSADFNKIDWASIKKDVGFLILRAGVTRVSSSPLGIGADTYFEKFAKKCNEFAIPFWAYYYSQGKTMDKARAEAEYLYKIAAPYKPVGYALDCEEKDIKVASFFARLLELGARKTMLYIGNNWYPIYNFPVDKDGFVACTDAVWIPRYGLNDGTAKPKYLPNYPCDLWQYTSKFSYAGIPDKTIDANAITGQRRDMAWFRSI